MRTSSTFAPSDPYENHSTTRPTVSNQPPLSQGTATVVLSKPTREGIQMGTCSSLLVMQVILLLVLLLAWQDLSGKDRDRR